MKDIIEKDVADTSETTIQSILDNTTTAINKVIDSTTVLEEKSAQLRNHELAGTLDGSPGHISVGMGFEYDAETGKTNLNGTADYMAALQEHVFNPVAHGYMKLDSGEAIGSIKPWYENTPPPQTGWSYPRSLFL